ncbi:AbrB/MazE/SpoVT family DNA-binding domain-containing protein [Streptomyces acidiscabies]|uniref:AbrB/MazE/SpoVT family DNA-binding domain-containing protein n=1 Tax=Streptomyces acidiscabies TaxID=42234 RepID=A0AAP6EKG6_9ACTN|nr:AbrB/MazE/SpoVT family DNA-binding domain-containing protein [Streptomyces acidiscabies]MBP5940056.1 AbrB/MazE/SpoVT family DNA-binding domain-containing protein [Streptomyces sp. LBUM 1476]MBZ3911254.1 AbrB/MazE/SpoVT family DNA-binding domain-containing protein [Streptomyces acidiscabies]MDX2965556.1 AbrB/MazE/SpoVT family DNA-binding domain-containing protein [Streptomyces acidiscabies]MDX3025124.1 AbrB/MazE/SpoVT family DNA-binding domain-containing protein [Streptomyces acidiscabies]MD
MTSVTFQASVREKGQLTLPVGVREALGVSPGDELEFEINDAGVVEVHGLRKIRTDQAWFWTERWQAGEREASEDIAAGRTTRHEDVDDMFTHLGEES